MTRKEFDNKVEGFCYLVKENIDFDLSPKYVAESIFEFYGKNRYIPRLYMKGTTLGMK